METAGDMIFADWEDPRVQHAVNGAFMDLEDPWDPTSEESRTRLLKLIHQKGLPCAELEYDPAEGKPPRIWIRSEGRGGVTGQEA